MKCRAWTIPAVFALLSVAFLPGIVSAATAPRWALLSVAAPLLLFGTRSLPWRSAPWPFWFFFCFSLCSGFWASSWQDWTGDAWKLMLAGMVFLIGATLDRATLERTFVALGWTVVLLHLPLAMLQLMDVHTGVVAVNNPASVFINKDFFAEAMLVIAVGLLGFRRWRLAAVTIACLLLTQDRAVLLGLAAGLSVLLASRKVTIGFIVLAIAGVLAITWHEHGSEHELLDSSTRQRLAIWHDAARGVTVIGHGLGSFYTVSPRYQDQFDNSKLRSEFAHDEYLHFAFELGVGSLGLVIGLLALLRVADEPSRAVLAAIAVVALFAFPFHLPFTLVVAALVAGRLAGVRYRVRLGLPADPVARSSAAVYGSASAGDLDYRAGTRPDGGISVRPRYETPPLGIGAWDGGQPLGRIYDSAA